MFNHRYIAAPRTDASAEVEDIREFSGCKRVYHRPLRTETPNEADFWALRHRRALRGLSTFLKF